MGSKQWTLRASPWAEPGRRQASLGSQLSETRTNVPSFPSQNDSKSPNKNGAKHHEFIRVPLTWHHRRSPCVNNRDGCNSCANSHDMYSSVPTGMMDIVYMIIFKCETLLYSIKITSMFDIPSTLSKITYYLTCFITTTKQTTQFVNKKTLLINNLTVIINFHASNHFFLAFLLLSLSISSNSLILLFSSMFSLCKAIALSYHSFTIPQGPSITTAHGVISNE